MDDQEAIASAAWLAADGDSGDPDYAAFVAAGGSDTQWDACVATWNQEVAERIKGESLDHRGCARAAYDREFGVVCSCGAVLGWSDHFVISGDGGLVASETTTAALSAKPVDVNGISSAVDPADPILATLDIIDPTMPYDARMVEEHLLDAVARLERGAHYERVCAEDYARFVLQWEMDYARAIVAADGQGGAADLRKARATLACERQYMERMIAKMKLDAIQGTMHSLRSVISSYQSVAKSVASSMGAYGNGRSAT